MVGLGEGGLYEDELPEEPPKGLTDPVEDGL